MQFVHNELTFAPWSIEIQLTKNHNFLSIFGLEFQPSGTALEIRRLQLIAIILDTEITMPGRGPAVVGNLPLDPQGRHVLGKEKLDLLNNPGDTPYFTLTGRCIHLHILQR